MMPKISDMRCQVKHNFLNQIIFKIDYEGVLDSDVDSFIQGNRDIFKQEGFSKLQQGVNSIFDVQIQEGGGDNDSNVSVHPRDKGKVFHIQSKDGNFIEFNKSSFVFLIRPNDRYKKIDRYFEFINNVVKNMTNYYSFPEVIRIGLRKINLLYVMNLDKINDIFKLSAFNICNLENDIAGTACKNSNETSLLIKNDHYVNYVRNFQEGILDGNKAYQLMLDVEVFQQRNENIKHIISNPSSFREFLIENNNVLFEVFFSSLQDEFKNKLMKENFDDDGILGVR